MNSSHLRNLAKIAATKKPHLIKFGKRKYLEKYSLKVSLASTFDDPSLSSAQRDEELKARYNPNPGEVKLAMLDGTPINGVESIEFTHESLRDYYVFCTSLSFDPRLAVAFSADACLFIYNSAQFAAELGERMRTVVRLEDYGFRAVEYYDPVTPRLGQPCRVEFLKHKAYQYQGEYRHVFIPEEGQKLRPHVVFEMPSAKAYAEFVGL